MNSIWDEHRAHGIFSHLNWLDFENDFQLIISHRLKQWHWWWWEAKYTIWLLTNRLEPINCGEDAWNMLCAKVHTSKFGTKSNVSRELTECSVFSVCPYFTKLRISREKVWSIIGMKCCCKPAWSFSWVALVSQSETDCFYHTVCGK